MWYKYFEYLDMKMSLLATILNIVFYFLPAFQWIQFPKKWSLEFVYLGPILECKDLCYVICD